MRIAAANRRARRIEKMQIRLSRDYLAGFDQFQMNPNPDEIDGSDYIFEFEKVEPGERREITLDFQGVLPGVDRGSASVFVEGRPAGRVSFSTIVLP
jgi:hypothetical protein